jgi:hypothetical protein
MSKSEAPVFRPRPDVLEALEEAARRLGSTVDMLLDQITRDWLDTQALNDDAEQARLHAAAAATFGAFAGGDPQRSEQAREAVRDRIAARSHRARASTKRERTGPAPQRSRSKKGASTAS